MALVPTHAQSLMSKTKHTVNGYLRNMQKSLSISIPSGLLVLFALFYGDQIDKFDEKVIGKCLKLSDNNLTVTNNATSTIHQGNAL